MAGQLDAAERLVGRLYTTFILRDLTFFVSGALVLVFWLPRPLLRTFSVFLLGGEDTHWLGTAALLAVSYTLGVILQEAVRLFLEPLSQSHIRRKLGGSAMNRELVARIDAVHRAGCSRQTLDGLERILFIKQIAATQCSALLALILLSCTGLLRPPMPSCLVLLSLATVVLCGWVYIDKARQQEEILVDLEWRYVLGARPLR